MNRASRIPKAPLPHVRRADPRRDNQHRIWVKTLPCLGCGARPPCDPAHLRFNHADAELKGAMGKRPPDRQLVPLCRKCHDAEEAGKLTFWGALMGQGVSDPVAIAQRLYRISGDTDRGFAAIAHGRPGLHTAWLPA